MLASTAISRPLAASRPALRNGGRRRAQPRLPHVARRPAVAFAEAAEQPKKAHAAADTAQVVVQFRLQRRWALRRSHRQLPRRRSRVFGLRLAGMPPAVNFLSAVWPMDARLAGLP